MILRSTIQYCIYVHIGEYQIAIAGMNLEDEIQKFCPFHRPLNSRDMILIDWIYWICPNFGVL